MTNLMKRFGLAVAVLMLASAGSGRAEAGLLFFTNEASFDAATSSLSTQTFAAANIAAGSVVPVDSPLNSATNDGIFAPGNILAGLTISSPPQPGEPALTIVGVNGYSNVNKMVSVTQTDSPLSLGFAPPVTAASANLFSIIDNSSPSVSVSVYSPTSTVLGTGSAPNLPGSGSGKFFGVIATNGDTIGLITFGPFLGHLGIDRVQFGTAASSAVPEPSSLTMTGIAGLLALGSRRFRRKMTPAW
jgi:hypothetical protein